MKAFPARNAANAHKTKRICKATVLQMPIWLFGPMNKRNEQRVAPPVAEAVNLEWRGLRAEVRLPIRLSDRQRQLLLATMMEPGGLQEACREAGVTLGMVLGERLCNPAFRRLWEKAQKERRAILETLLMDMAVRGLLPGATAAHSEAREKFLTGLAQSLAAAEAPAAKRSRKPAEPRAAARRPADDPDELTRLIAEVERKVQAAEKALGD